MRRLRSSRDGSPRSFLVMTSAVITAVAASGGCDVRRTRAVHAPDHLKEQRAQAKKSIKTSGILDVAKRYDRLESCDFDVNYVRYLVDVDPRMPKGVAGKVQETRTGTGRFERAENEASLHFSFKEESCVGYYKYFYVQMQSPIAAELRGDEWMERRYELDVTPHESSLRLLWASLDGREIAIEDAANALLFANSGIEPAVPADEPDRAAELTKGEGFAIFASQIGNPFGVFDRPEYLDSFVEAIGKSGLWVWETGSNSNVFTATWSRRPGYHPRVSTRDVLSRQYTLHIDPTTKLVSKIESTTTYREPGGGTPTPNLHYSVEFGYKNIEYGTHN